MSWTRIFAIVTGLILLANPVHAGFRSAQLTVNGMSCPFCTFGIEKKLLDVPGVLDVEVFLDEGRIALTFESGNEATVGDLEQAVRKAGFGVTALRLVTNGEIKREGQGEVRLVVHSAMTFRLSEDTDGRDQPLSEESLHRLGGTGVSAGQTLVLEGTVEERDAKEPRLFVRKIESVSGSPE